VPTPSTVLPDPDGDAELDRPSPPGPSGTLHLRDAWDEGSQQSDSPRRELLDSVGMATAADQLEMSSGSRFPLELSLEEVEESSGLPTGLAPPGAIRGARVTWMPGETLGRGALGRVVKGMDTATGQVFAVKEVHFDGRDDTDLKFKRSLECEIDILSQLQHPNIVSYRGHDELGSCLYVYLEYMPGGSVAQVLAQFGPFEEPLVRSHSRGLLRGLEYLHTRQPAVLHRDIKGANVLVGLNGAVKLSDFGCSKRTADTMSRTLKGSVPWMAPEVIQQNGQAGRRSDVWSLGCVVIEMATSRQPWGGFDNHMAAMFKIAMSKETPPVPDGLSEECQDFIRQCTRRDKASRPQATALLQHGFVRDMPEAQDAD